MAAATLQFAKTMDMLASEKRTEKQFMKLIGGLNPQRMCLPSAYFLRIFPRFMSESLYLHGLLWKVTA